MAATDKVLQTLFADPYQTVYAVIDGAIYPGLPERLAVAPQSLCLLRGDLDAQVAQAAPYLVQLEQHNELTDELVAGWGQHWGIFALSAADWRTLRQHFRGLFLVYSPDGQPLYFRYYDPRVLRTYLPTCSAAELATVFGPVSQYILEGERDQTLLRCGYRVEQLHLDTITL